MPSKDRQRLVSGRWAVVYEAKNSESCNGCSRSIKPGEQYVTSRIRQSGGKITRVILCVANCEPLDDEGPSTPEGNAMRIEKLRGSHAPCGYCGKEKLSARLRQRIDPKTFRIAHEMILCTECADGSGYSIPSQTRNTNLIARPTGMPRLGS